MGQPYRWRSAPALALCRTLALCRSIALCRSLAFESRVHVRETALANASVRTILRAVQTGNTRHGVHAGCRRRPGAFLRPVRTQVTVTARTPAHVRTGTADFTPPRPRGRRRVTASQPQRPACVRSLARDPPQSVSAASRPIRPNRPSPRMTGAGMRCPAGQDSQRPRRGRGSP